MLQHKQVASGSLRLLPNHLNTPLYFLGPRERSCWPELFPGLKAVLYYCHCQRAFPGFHKGWISWLPGWVSLVPGRFSGCQGVNAGCQGVGSLVPGRVSCGARQEEVLALETPEDGSNFHLKLWVSDGVISFCFSRIRFIDIQNYIFCIAPTTCKDVLRIDSLICSLTKGSHKVRKAAQLWIFYPVASLSYIYTSQCLDCKASITENVIHQK